MEPETEDGSVEDRAEINCCIARFIAFYIFSLSAAQQHQRQQLWSIVQDPEVSGDDLVLEDGALGDVDDLVLVGDDDDFSAQRDVLAERHVARHGEVVQVDQVRYALHAGEELAHLVEREREAKLG